MNRIFDEKQGKFFNRLNNLKINGEYSDFLYMGSMESTFHNAWLKNNEGCKDLGRLFDVGESLRINPCSHCEDFDICDDKVSDIDGGFIVEPDIVQELVYYNHKTNSAIIFSVYMDSSDGRFGFETIADLIGEIYEGLSSPFSYLTDENRDSDFMKAIYEKNNIVYVHYSCGDIVNDIYHLNLHYGSLKEINVKSMIDILKIVH